MEISNPTFRNAARVAFGVELCPQIVIRSMERDELLSLRFEELFATADLAMQHLLNFSARRSERLFDVRDKLAEGLS